MIHRFKGVVPNRTVLTSDASCKFRGIQTTHTSDQLSTNSGVPMTTHFRSDNLLERLIEFRKVLDLQFYYEDTNQDKDWEVPKHRAFIFSSWGIRMYHPPCTSIFSPARKPPWASVSRVFLGFHYVAMIALSGLVIEFNFQPLLLSEGQEVGLIDGSKSQNL